jgi:hypothetical protein
MWRLIHHSNHKNNETGDVRRAKQFWRFAQTQKPTGSGNVGNQSNVGDQINPGRQKINDNNNKQH